MLDILRSLIDTLITLSHLEKLARLSKSEKKCKVSKLSPTARGKSLEKSLTFHNFSHNFQVKVIIEMTYTVPVYTGSPKVKCNVTLGFDEFAKSWCQTILVIKLQHFCSFAKNIYIIFINLLFIYLLYLFLRQPSIYLYIFKHRKSIKLTMYTYSLLQCWSCCPSFRNNQI